MRRTLSNSSLAALAALALPLFAEVGLPVGVSLSTPDSLRPGQPVNVIATFEPAIDVQYATFQVDQPAHWQLLDGATRWAGSFEKNKRITMTFRAVPLVDDPQPLRASLTVDGYRPRRFGLDPARSGRNFPEEVMFEDLNKSAPREAVEVFRAQYDPGVVLPEPAAATAPRVPGEEAAPVASQQRVSKSGKSRNASVVANGRFTFLDANNVRRGVRNASVELYNEDSIAVFTSLCGRGTTDADGNFTISADCGDLAFGNDANPDLFVKLVLNNSVVEVKPDNFFAGTYTVRSSTKNNVAGTVNFNTLTIPSSVAGAAAAHNLVMRAQQFMATVGESMSKVTVLWPSLSDSPVAFYTPVLATLNIRTNEPFNAQSTIFHEYGHHVLITKAESPIPDYSNGKCDSNNHPGHCINRAEKGAIAWTEGFPDFLGFFLHNQFAAADGFGSPTFDIENLVPADGETDLTHIEGVTAAILLDLVDSNNEPGDNMDLSFQNIWDVVKDYDPSSDIFHNHPTSILEFYDGLREQRLSQINRIAEVYAHNGITRPRPDLRMSTLQDPPTSLTVGASFSNDSTIANTGNERANASFNVRYQLILDTNRTVTRTLGNETIDANMLGGASEFVTKTFTVPAGTAPGLYRLVACTDTANAVPESSEANNCTTAAVKLQVR